MRYICFGYYKPAKHASMTDAQREAMLDKCFEYDDCLRANGNWAGGEALQPSETAVTVHEKNGKVAMVDGPFAETKEQLGGIILLEARDKGQAIEIISRHPALKYGGKFEIRPTADMTEMIQASERRRRRLQCEKASAEVPSR